jgi:hypothetical protein
MSTFRRIRSTQTWDIHSPYPPKQGFGLSILNLRCWNCLILQLIIRAKHAFICVTEILGYYSIPSLCSGRITCLFESNDSCFHPANCQVKGQRYLVMYCLLKIRSQLRKGLLYTLYVRLPGILGTEAIYRYIVNLGGGQNSCEGIKRRRFRANRIFSAIKSVQKYSH